MKIIYFFVTYKDGLNVYKTYFEQEGGFLQAFGIAAGVALLMAVIFYLIIGYFCHKLAEPSTWWGALVAAVILSFVLTNVNTGMTSKSRGLGYTLEQRWKHSNFDAEKKPVYEGLKKDFKKGIVKVKPVRALCIGNCIYSGFFFYLFSLVFLLIFRDSKTNDCSNIPHRLMKK